MEGITRFIIALIGFAALFWGSTAITNMDSKIHNCTYNMLCMHIHFNNTMERRIGEIITLPDGRRVEVVEGRCRDCAISKIGIIGCITWRERGRIGECLKEKRSDHKDIIYKEVK